MKRFVIITALTLGFVSPAMALRGNYKVYEKRNGRMVRTDNTSSGNFRYIKSSGQYRQILDVDSGKVLYVHRYAIENSDQANQFASVSAARSSVRSNSTQPQTNPDRSYHLSSGFNVRKNPQGTVIGNTNGGNFRATNKTVKDGRGNTWYEVVNDRGAKGYVFGDGVRQITVPPKDQTSLAQTVGSQPVPPLPSRPTVPTPKLPTRPTAAAPDKGSDQSVSPFPSFSINQPSDFVQHPGTSTETTQSFPGNFANSGTSRYGSIMGNALMVNKHDRKLGRCVSDKERLAKINGQALKFNRDHYLKIIQQGVPSEALATAMDVFDEQQNIIKNKNYITIADFGLNSNRKRLFVINTQTGEVFKTYTAHGKNSDRDNNGCIDVTRSGDGFSNEFNTNKSSKGFMLTGGFYTSGKNGKSMLMHGLEKDINDKACGRAIVMHGANYVPGGRSFGCPSVSHGDKAAVYGKIGHGSLFYSYPGDSANSCQPKQGSVRQRSSKKTRSKKSRRRKR